MGVMERGGRGFEMGMVEMEVGTTRLIFVRKCLAVVGEQRSMTKNLKIDCFWITNILDFYQVFPFM